jgi:hypothetical protein
MGKVHVYEWFLCFNDGHQPLYSDLCGGMLVTAQNPDTIACVWDIIREDHRLTTDKVVGMWDVSHGMCSVILLDNLNMHHVYGHKVPKTSWRTSKKNVSLLADSCSTEIIWIWTFLAGSW